MRVLRHRHEGKEFEKVKAVRVQFKDYFNAGDFITQIHDWLVEHEWGSMVDFQFPEQFYHHKFTQQAGEEVRIRWRFKKSPKNNNSKFFLYELDLDFRIIGLKGAEVMKNGMKFKTNTGDIEITGESRLVYDANKEWRNNSFLNSWKTAFIKRIAKRNVSQHFNTLRRETIRVENALKAYFKLPYYTTEGETEGELGFTKDFD